MPKEQNASGPGTREALVQSLNEDLAREYQAILAYIVYSQMLKGPDISSIKFQLKFSRDKRSVWRVQQLALCRKQRLTLEN